MQLSQSCQVIGSVQTSGTPIIDLPVIHLDQYELEALHLCDGVEKTMEEAGA